MLKRITLLLFICFAALCLGPPAATAGMYVMDTDTAINLRAESWSDASDYGSNSIRYIGYNPGTLADRVDGAFPSYGGKFPMYYNVGFAGDLTDWGGDGVASVDIGALDNTNGVRDFLKLQGSYDSYGLAVANDNGETWEYQLYAGFDGDTPLTSSWTALNSGEHAFMTLDFGGSRNFIDLDTLGFTIRSTTEGDVFHTSVVPAPAAIVLGIIGLSVVGVKLRKYA